MSFEKTRIYERSLELVELCHNILQNLPTGFGFLADQLKRAVSSVCLNFAEGYNKGSLAEQRRFFRMSRCSAQEIIAILDVANKFKAINYYDYVNGKELCDHIIRMLYLFRK